MTGLWPLYARPTAKSTSSASDVCPSCPAASQTGKSIAQVEKRTGEAIDFHIEGMREAGEPVPPPMSSGRRSSKSPRSSPVPIVVRLEDERGNAISVEDPNGSSCDGAGDLDALIP